MEPPIATVVNIDSVCRLCANLQENLVPLFEGEGQDNNLPDRISKYLDFSVHLKKGLPSSVCVQCTMSLLDWHRFYKNCEKVNEHFRELLLSNGSMSINILLQESKATTDSVPDDDDDDVVGIDFDEDSSAFNKILKEAEINELDKAVVQEEVVVTTENIMMELIDEPEPEEEIFITEEPEPPAKEDQQKTVLGSEKRKSGRRKLPSKQRSLRATKEAPSPPAKRHRESEGVSCNDCQELFASSSALKKHKIAGCYLIEETEETAPTVVVAKKTPQKTSSTHNYNCPICHAPFNRKFNRDQHMSSHTNDVPCRICCFSYRSETALQSHLVAAHSAQQVKRYLSLTPKSVKCGKCAEAFNSYYQLYHHDQRVHLGNTGEASLKCRECDKFFPTERLLLSHTAKKHVDPDTKGTTCDVCGKVYATKQTLAFHMRIHTGSKPVSCTDCKEKFRCESLYRQHRISHHLHSAFKCALCGQTFSRSNHLGKHLKNHFTF